MLTDLYQEYLYIIGKMKDIYKLDVDPEHKEIHTFYREKRPLFKLFYGVFKEDKHASIVVSFHIDMYHPEAIQWFINLYNVSPQIALHDSYVEDSAGETYLGEDAVALKQIYVAQDVLHEWLENYDVEDIQAFVEAPVSGRDKKSNPTFDSQAQRTLARIEFDKIRKPDAGEDIH